MAGGGWGARVAAGRGWPGATASGRRGASGTATPQLPPSRPPGCPEGTGGDGVAQPAPPGLPHIHPAPRNRVRRRPRPAPGWAARSGGVSPAGLAEGVPASAEGDGDRDGDRNGDRDSLASSSVGAGRSGLVYQDGGAIPPARSASRGSGAERKADVTPCFWVQTIGIQERGAAQLREPAAPSSARPAIASFSPGPPRSTAL